MNSYGFFLFHPAFVTQASKEILVISVFFEARNKTRMNV